MKNRLVTILRCSAFLMVTALGSTRSALGQETYISIKSGGGFTGTATEYRLYSTGAVMKGKGLAELSFTEKASLSKRSTRKYFKRAAAIVFSSFNHPGNLYHTITYVTDGKSVSNTWGDNGHTPPADSKKLYDDLSDKVKTLKFSASN
jgi:hypothetical protein